MHSLLVKSKKLIQAIRPQTAKLPIGKLVTASESPMGFAVIAGLGLTIVIASNVFDGIPVDHDMAANNFVQESAATTNSTAEPASAQISGIDTQLTNTPEIETLKLSRGETLIELLSRAGFNRRNAHQAINALGEVTNLRRLQRGQEVQFKRTSIDADEIEELWIRDAFDTQAYIARDINGYRAARPAIKTLPLTHLVAGTITDNLYLSAKRAGLPDSVIIDLIRMMSFDVDFEREIRVGDSFEVYFERRYAPEFDDTENGRILHVNLGLQKRNVDATWFAPDGTDGDYFDSSGESTRRALMKTPLDVAVVTSSYGRRKHPVLGYTRMHKGVDFRAPTGTPIMAAGDGVIEMSARNGSYGNYVRIRHSGAYKTAYGHLSKFGKGIKKGQRVKQGQIIGYSGATGRVTAAHLHYEVLFNGKQTNPLTLKLPTGKTLKGEELNLFKAQRDVIVADMLRIADHSQMRAALDPSTELSR